MKPSLAQSVLPGSRFTVRHVKLAPAKRAEEFTPGESPQRFNVLCLLAGSLTWRTEAGEAGTLAAGGALLLTPGERVKLTVRGVPDAKQGETTELIIVAPDQTLLVEVALRHNFVSREADIKLRSRLVPRDRRLNHLATELRDEITSGARGQASYVAALVDQLTIHLLREHATFRVEPSLELSRVGLIDRRIRRAVELMHAHMERELTLGQLADAAYLSSFHFARLFKKLVGTSPHAYLAAIRAAEAERLLAETDLSITEISQRVGYASPSHFAKAFRAATGLSPRDFRRSVISQ